MFAECIFVRRSPLQEDIVWMIVLLSRSDDRKYGSVRTFHDSRALPCRAGDTGTLWTLDLNEPPLTQT